MRLFGKVAGVTVALLCGLSAAVQLNDPDWLPWFAYYCLATVAALAAPWTRRGWMAAAALTAVALVWAAVIGSAGLDPITWEELTGDLKMKTLNVERHREIGGLLLVALMLGGLGGASWWSQRTPGASPAQG
ncbi:MAG: transmembrane 220 family protein [Deltaproteobacteria bacterium]|nr:transmembrane 220 family protein [Deltaproteobacteria bacterium]